MKKPVEYSIMRCLGCNKEMKIGDEAPGYPSYCQNCAGLFRYSKMLYNPLKEQRVKLSPHTGHGIVNIGLVVCAKHGEELVYYLTLDVACAEPPGTLSLRIEPCSVCLRDAEADADRRSP